MDDNFERYNDSRRGRGRNNVLTGLFLLAAGGLLLAQKSGMLFPEWFFTWPVFLIALGLFIGLRRNFKGGPWLILILIGSIFLAEKISDSIYLRPYFWPIILIAAGLYIMLGGRRLGRRNRFRHDTLMENMPVTNAGLPTDNTRQSGDSNFYMDSRDIIDITAIFSGVKKNILSKNFMGGDVVAIMGGAEINLTKADFQQKVVMDITCVFGGTKLIVPPNWEVQSQVVAIFGGVDDKRPQSTDHDPSKIIFLEGTCLFGGIEIRSF